MTSSAPYPLEFSREPTAHVIMALSVVALYLVLRWFTRTRSFYAVDARRGVGNESDAKLVVPLCVFPWARGFTWIALALGCVACAEGAIMHYRYAPQVGAGGAAAVRTDADGGALISGYQAELESSRALAETPSTNPLRGASRVDTPPMSKRGAGIAALIVLYLQACPIALVLTGSALTGTCGVALFGPKRLVQRPSSPAVATPAP